MLLEWNDRWRCLTDYDRLCKSVNLWNSHAGLAPEASNIPNEIQVLNWGLNWSFPLFIRRTDYWNYYWNQICKNKLINPLVRGTLDFVLVQSSLPPRKAEDLIGLFMTAWHLCLRVGGFQNPGVCLQAFPSFPSIHRPVILCSRTAQKRFLRRLTGLHRRCNLPWVTSIHESFP